MGLGLSESVRCLPRTTPRDPWQERVGAGMGCSRRLTALRHSSCCGSHIPLHSNLSVLIMTLVIERRLINIWALHRTAFLANGFDSVRLQQLSFESYLDQFLWTCLYSATGGPLSGRLYVFLRLQLRMLVVSHSACLPLPTDSGDFTTTFYATSTRSTLGPPSIDELSSIGPPEARHRGNLEPQEHPSWHSSNKYRRQSRFRRHFR